MRDIKFRAWDGEKMRSPNLINTSNSLSPLTCYTIDDLEPGHFDVDNLMQFTGMYDKNGKEIYEGDIVKVWGDDKNIATIFYKCACFMLEWHDGSNYDLLGWYSFKRGAASDPKDFEVIGNIHENPELLK